MKVTVIRQGIRMDEGDEITIFRPQTGPEWVPFLWEVATPGGELRLGELLRILNVPGLPVLEMAIGTPIRPVLDEARGAGGAEESLSDDLSLRGIETHVIGPPGARGISFGLRGWGMVRDRVSGRWLRGTMRLSGIDLGALLSLPIRHDPRIRVGHEGEWIDQPILLNEFLRTLFRELAAGTGRPLSHARWMRETAARTLYGEFGASPR
jgi:hypothetical protein